MFILTDAHLPPCKAPASPPAIAGQPVFAPGDIGTRRRRDGRAVARGGDVRRRGRSGLVVTPLLPGDRRPAARVCYNRRLVAK